MDISKIAILIATLFFVNIAFADDGWYVVTKSKDGNDEYSMKFGTGEFSKNKNGDPMTVVVGKISHAKQNNTDLNKWYVTDQDCINEYGKLVVLDIDGTFKFDTSFAKGSNTIGSAIAEIICNIRSNEIKKRNEAKGI